VVARLWVREAGHKAPVRRVLTLGSPQHGTSQAALGLEFVGSCPAACKQLVPDSDLLRHLNAGDETPDGPLWATVRSTSDRVVTPVDSAALAGAVNIVVQDSCPGSAVAHGDLPANPVVLAALESVLSAGPPQLPIDVNC
jgi:triacylglycerol lipase